MTADGGTDPVRSVNKIRDGGRMAHRRTRGFKMDRSDTGRYVALLGFGNCDSSLVL